MRQAEATGSGTRTSEPSDIAARLLAWYDRHARRLPWRVGPKERAAGERPDPYRVWLSEVMLQQTTVAAVKPYFETFLVHWPTVTYLAEADTDDVMRAWAGLGYYSRARNLKAAAEAVAEMGGVFPDTAAALQGLPGIGAYTAAAIAAIAFDRPEPVVDGNIERVITRLFAMREALPAAKAAIRARQAELTPLERPGDYAQAMMDLGATICTPKRPACSLCPLNDICLATAADPEAFPVKAEKAARPTRYGVAYVAVRADGAVLLRKRPPKGLLGGMAEVPGSAWSDKDPSPSPSPQGGRESMATGPTSPSPQGRDESAKAATGPASPSPLVGESRGGGHASAPLDLAWRNQGKVVHVFTHFRLELDVLVGEAPAKAEAPEGGWWSSPADLPGEALPSVMKKVIEAALPGATKKNR